MISARGAHVALACTLAACATAGRDSLHALEESIEAYNDAFRWQNFDAAAVHLPNDRRAAFISTHEDRERDLRVETFRILKVDMKGEDAAEATVTVRFTLLPSITVESRKLVQHWHRVQGLWVLEAEDHSIIEVDEAEGGAPPPKAPGEADGADGTEEEAGGEEDWP